MALLRAFLRLPQPPSEPKLRAAAPLDIALRNVHKAAPKLTNLDVMLHPQQVVNAANADNMANGVLLAGSWHVKTLLGYNLHYTTLQLPESRGCQPRRKGSPPFPACSRMPAPEAWSFPGRITVLPADDASQVPLF